MAVEGRHLVSYLLRTVRVGINATWIAVAGLALFLFLSPEGVQETLFIYVLVAAIAGALLMQALPWERLLGTKWGMPALYLWSILDILLITILIEATGGRSSLLFVMYALTTVFFSASYPRVAQIGLLLFTAAAYIAGNALWDWNVEPGGILVRFSILGALTYIVSFLSAELIAQNAQLEAQVTEHQKTAARLIEVQELAQLGSWTWEPRGETFTCTNELRAIYGLGSEGCRSFDPLVIAVHPDDRPAFQRALEAAKREGRGFALEHRVIHPDESEHHVQAQGRVESTSDGAVVLGTALDVTERKRASEYELRLRELETNRRQALQINDNIVQGLTVATYAIDMNRLDMARSALEKTLAAARKIIGGLLDQGDAEIKEGDLVRSEAAVLDHSAQN